MSPDFGFHHEYHTVKLCRIFLTNWNMPPDVTLRQNRELLFDILRDINLGDAIEKAQEDGGCQTVDEIRSWLETHASDDEIYEEQIADVQPIRF